VSLLLFSQYSASSINSKHNILSVLHLTYSFRSFWLSFTALFIYQESGLSRSNSRAARLASTAICYSLWLPQHTEHSAKGETWQAAVWLRWSDGLSFW